MAQSGQPKYNDLNADKFPEPVEPIQLDKYNLSSKTVDVKDVPVIGTFGLLVAHAVVRRSLRCVAKHARNLKPSQRGPFLVYAGTSLRFLDAHHNHEDELWFPVSKPYVDFSESEEEHKPIEHQMENINKLLKVGEEHVKGSPNSPAWPGEEISKATEDMLEILLPHLQKEEALACLYGRRVPDEVYHDFDKKIGQVMQNEAKKEGPVWFTSYLLKHWNAGEKTIWPPIPKVVQVVMSFLGWLWYSKELEFCPTAEELQA